MTLVLVHPVLSPIRHNRALIRPGDFIASGGSFPVKAAAELFACGALGAAEEREFAEGDRPPLFPLFDEIAAGPVGQLAGSDGGGGVAAVAAPTPDPVPAPVADAPAPPPVGSEPTPAPTAPAEKPAGKPRTGKAAS